MPDIKLTACLVVLLPLIGFAFNFLLGKRLRGNTAGIIGSLTVLGSFICTLLLFNFVQQNPDGAEVRCFSWITAGNLHIDFSFLVDRLSVLMLLIITGVGFLIHVYSVGYMHGDDGYSRFFAYLNLFIFFMETLVMGAGFVVTFIGWEGVGLCSYLLIGFWFKNHEYNNAAKKAFIMNRIGDLGFLLGIFLIFNVFGTLDYKGVFGQAVNFNMNDGWIVAITLLLFVGATGKSAQIPLYTWLPDAMAGPTPVSALIHAATMVTAGIFLIVRSHILFSLAPVTQGVITGIALATAFFAATIGVAQNDIKKVLAYSTVSQLGFMFIALGLGAYSTGMFHLLTHAFFKALLFLGAGSVIHAMSGEQDILKMGGLRKKLPITFMVFLIGTLAITGIPPFAGFFSKDEILAHAFEANPLYWVIGLASSALTAIYMFRLLFLTFYGKFRGTPHQAEHVHESPSVMTIPLIVLAVLSTFGGFLGLPEMIGPHAINKFLEPVLADNAMVVKETGHAMSAGLELGLMGVAVAITLIIIFVTSRRFIIREEDSTVVTGKQNGLMRLLAHKYYVDEIYDAVIVKPADALSGFWYRYIENGVIDGIVNGTGRLSTAAGGYVRRLQAGNIGFYIFAMVVSIILLLLVNTWLIG